MEKLLLKNTKTIILVSDTCPPNTNGVSTTMKNYIKHIPELGYDLICITPDGLPYFNCPFSNDVKLAYGLEFKKEYFDKSFAVHIMTEGTLGIQARKFCIRNDIKFTTSYLTMFPEYIQKHLLVPIWITRKYFKWFHEKSEKVFCCTEDLANKLDWIKKEKAICPKGVDAQLFCIKKKKESNIKTALYVGRISREKNIDDFCKLNLPDIKIAVGDGPQLEELKKKYPTVSFIGKLKPEELVEYYQNADVFVFPSKTDTYGLVMLEALACGTPVVGYPINGALDLADDNTVFVDDDLNHAISIAFDHADKNEETYKNKMAQKSWMKSTEELCSQLIFNSV